MNLNKLFEDEENAISLFFLCNVPVVIMIFMRTSVLWVMAMCDGGGWEYAAGLLSIFFAGYCVLCGFEIDNIAIIDDNSFCLTCPLLLMYDLLLGFVAYFFVGLLQFDYFSLSFLMNFQISNPFVVCGTCFFGVYIFYIIARSPSSGLSPFVNYLVGNGLYVLAGVVFCLGVSGWHSEYSLLDSFLANRVAIATFLSLAFLWIYLNMPSYLYRSKFKKPEQGNTVGKIYDICGIVLFILFVVFIYSSGGSDYIMISEAYYSEHIFVPLKDILFAAIFILLFFVVLERFDDVGGDNSKFSPFHFRMLFCTKKARYYTTFDSLFVFFLMLLIVFYRLAVFFDAEYGCLFAIPLCIQYMFILKNRVNGENKKFVFPDEWIGLLLFVANFLIFYCYRYWVYDIYNNLLLGNILVTLILIVLMCDLFQKLKSNEKESELKEKDKVFWFTVLLGMFAEAWVFVFAKGYYDISVHLSLVCIMAVSVLAMIIFSRAYFPIKEEVGKVDLNQKYGIKDPLIYGRCSHLSRGIICCLTGILLLMIL